MILVSRSISKLLSRHRRWLQSRLRIVRLAAAAKEIVSEEMTEIGSAIERDYPIYRQKRAAIAFCSGPMASV
jgi:hypothetical protein